MERIISRIRRISLEDLHHKYYSSLVALSALFSIVSPSEMYFLTMKITLLFTITCVIALSKISNCYVNCPSGGSSKLKERNIAGRHGEVEGSVIRAKRDAENSQCPGIWYTVTQDLTAMFLTNGQCNDNARAAIRASFHVKCILL